MDRDTYNKATAKIRDLKSRLPEHAVRSLAEEVIRRTAILAQVEADLRETRVTPEQIISLTEALVGADPDAALLQVQGLQSAGVQLEDIYLIYLAAAAQRLGTLWEESGLTVAQVTLGTSRIYGILRALDPIRHGSHNVGAQSAMFASVPGDQHVLGLRMAADIFRQRGWEIELLIGLDHDEIVARVEDGAHLIIGLSAGGDHVIAALARLVLAIRMHKPGVRIFVGGQAVAENEDVIAAVSPDGMAADFEKAYDIMMELWREATAGAAQETSAH